MDANRQWHTLLNHIRTSAVWRSPPQHTPPRSKHLLPKGVPTMPQSLVPQSKFMLVTCRSQLPLQLQVAG